MKAFRQSASVLALGLSCVLSAGAHADGYPSRPIRIIIPTAAGGTVDLVARLIAKGLSQELHQSIIIDNRPAASGLLGAREVAHAKPDGYTLLAVANTFVSAPEFVPDADYDPTQDFSPITQTCQIPMVLEVNPGQPVHDVKELIARAKAHPGAISFGSSGVGSTGYIAAELFSHQAGIKMLSVPYKGNSQALTDVLSGRVQIMFDQVSTSAPYIQAGKLRGLGVTTSTRSKLLPDVPTIAEAALPGYDDVTFNGMLAPKGTPDAIVNRLHDAIAKVLTDPSIARIFAEQGIEVKVSDSPDAFRRYLRSEQTKYGQIARETASAVMK